MLDIRFDRAAPPSAIRPCSDPCKAAQARDDQLSAAVQKRIESYTGKPEPASGKPAGDDSPSVLSADSSPCRRRALTLGPTLRRFNRYRDALPHARAADDMNKLGDRSSDMPPAAPCLSRLPDKGEALCKELGLPKGAIQDRDLRNDRTGFRAVMYRDEGTGRLILVARDTQPTSLVDWLTNTRNGEGQDTKQYAGMRELTGALNDANVNFDLAGYSKGGGLAQEAALVSKDAKAYVFNSAGLHANSLARTGNRDFSSLASRTRAFSSQDDFLTDMNETTDPDLQIANMKFLRGELAGENRPWVHPMKIDHRNPEQPDGDPAFEEDRAVYLGELDGKIAAMERDRAAGRPVSAFPPVHAGQKEVIPGSLGRLSRMMGADKPGPNLGKLKQHQMENVLRPMEDNVGRDRDELEDFVKRCGLEKTG